MHDPTPPTHDNGNDPSKLQCHAGSLSSNREVPSPPALSAYNNNKQKSVSSNMETVQRAPNRILNWNELKGLIDKNLGPCSICKYAVCYLVEQKPICYASPIAIQCPFCKESKTQNTTMCIAKPKNLKNEMHNCKRKEKIS